MRSVRLWRSARKRFIFNVFGCASALSERAYSGEKHSV